MFGAIVVVITLIITFSVTAARDRYIGESCSELLLFLLMAVTCGAKGHRLRRGALLFYLYAPDPRMMVS